MKRKEREVVFWGSSENLRRDTTVQFHGAIRCWADRFPEGLKCPICGSGFMVPTDKRIHVRNMHLNATTQQIRCSLCFYELNPNWKREHPIPIPVQKICDDYSFPAEQQEEQLLTVGGVTQ